ncbi:divergent polysaccharide deacetylase family protein [Roseomonas sp. AR75]|uniref:divergent polysaccharide deacetylase family protein n=1 Tax=Roseomonas sp. AR75 TaxID=2562311 RepID=UPI0010BF66F5|nr:divergent polysaccharide deacetylase family protein [Roseomonas sp. AR75]
MRLLALFWAVVLLGLAGGAGVLQWLGPPDAAPAAMAPQAAEPPSAPIAAPTAASGGPSAASVPPNQPEPPSAPATPVAQPLPAAPPLAPEPPPLGAAQARLVTSDPVIAPPDPALLEPSRHGPVPRLGPEGRSAIRTYARPFDREDRRPRVGIIINNMGLFAQHSEEAIRRLPSGVTLAFSPYGLRQEPLLERARARGMELLIALPLEPQGYGAQADPGERALLTSLTVGENLDRLDWSVSRIQGAVGAIGGLGGMRGERFAANAELLGIVQANLTRRGLLYIDPRPGAPQPARAFGRSVDLLLDEPSAVRVEVERRLTELEEMAKRQGSALGLANDPVPSVVAAIAAWSAGLESRGVVVAPVTVLIRRPAEQAAQR